MQFLLEGKKFVFNSVLSLITVHKFVVQCYFGRRSQNNYQRSELHFHLFDRQKQDNFVLK